MGRAFPVLASAERERIERTAARQRRGKPRLSKPTVHRLPMSLVSHGLVEQEERSKRYRLGSRVAVLAHEADRVRELGPILLAERAEIPRQLAAR